MIFLVGHAVLLQYRVSRAMMDGDAGTQWSFDWQFEKAAMNALPYSLYNWMRSGSPVSD